MRTTIPRSIALLATGLLAGAFFYTYLNIVPTFYEVPEQVHFTFRTQLMTHNGIVMPALMALAIIGAVWYAIVSRSHAGARNFALLAAGLALTALLVTRFGNVPINQLMRTWSPANPPANWKELLHTWDIYHLIRTLAGIGSFIAFIIAVQLTAGNAGKA
ncbi:DUF1772 domain-containing protein [Paraflavitalea soli]|uniref:DUF1772 domain-containing protein n=1 Tax=Paraflavitalea soli TaxID=2315862 RepID=A0A3B7MIW0_9BACT|nr:DUF1772 domain-containing protein [Paraflavitalea soli]AXY73169.1 DUF1772 domain-containing protein [Paraflavitalea soli]